MTSDEELTEEATLATQEERLLECTHSLVNTCHYSYLTKYKASSEEQCEEIFSKRCQTVFSKEAETVIVEHCHQPVSRWDHLTFVNINTGHTVFFPLFAFAKRQFIWLILPNLPFIENFKIA